MSVNSSSSTNDSLLPCPSITSCHYPVMYCFMTRTGTFIYTSYCITIILLLLPLCILVFYLFLQRWRQQRSTSTTSHSDIFTYHMIMVELIGVSGSLICCGGIYRDRINTFLVGLHLWSFTWYGQMFFHTLTCVERYLAVVHPITYLSLRGERGIRIRNISIGCVWLLCFGGTSLITLESFYFYVEFCILIFLFILISFCSLSVLCVLIRPGPGEQGKDRERADQSKLKAFYTIMAILGVLLVRTVCSLVMTVFDYFIEDQECTLVQIELWFNVPSSLVLPLLFLHRAGILASCKNSIKRG